ncbi:MAG: PD-(D/E)XK nuclease family protein [Candidatus Diapherotrites archaeon]
MIYSYSGISTFELCPKKFEFQYLTKPKPDVPERESIHSFMGKRVHETLEKFYKDKDYEKEATLSELVKYYSKIWKEEWKNGIILDGVHSQKDFFNKGKRCLKNFYNDIRKKHNGDIIGIEKKIRFKLDEEEKYQMKGVIDLFLKIDEKHYQIVDYKTGQPHDQLQVDQDEQLPLYQIAIQERYPQAEKIDLIWHYLSINDSRLSSRTPQKLEALKKKTIQTIKAIENTQKFETKPGKLCGYCKYQPICPAFKHQEMLKTLPKTQYKKEEGLILADEYAKTYHELKRIEKELDSQLEVLKEKIFDYAKQHGFEVVQGTNCKLSLKKEVKTHFPFKNSKERATLNQLIEAHNLWKDLSELDTTKLWNYLKEGKIDPKLAKKIGSFLEEYDSKTIYIGKK